ncbi:MAG: LLM class flavin-dependent oxidoreductase, partial [Actinobacteria bacterium ATB1]|nr:LLM class flavin-dependent oxidoreductase [Actinobacteria bacterium ATB1]
EDTKGMWEEAMREIPRMWKETDYSHSGTWFDTPEAHPLEGMSGRNLLPKPYTQPHPPLWVAAGSPSTFEKAARLGLGVICFAFGDPAKLRPMIDTYKEIIQDPPDPVGDWVNNNVMAVTNMCVLEDRRDALELASVIGMSYYHSLVVRWLDSFPRPAGFPVWPQVLPEPTPEQLEALIPTGSVIIGDPDDAKKGVEVWEELGIDQLVVSPLTTQISLEDAKRTFARDPQHDQAAPRTVRPLGSSTRGIEPNGKRPECGSRCPEQRVRQVSGCGSVRPSPKMEHDAMPQPAFPGDVADLRGLRCPGPSPADRTRTLARSWGDVCRSEARRRAVAVRRKRWRCPST